MLPALPLYSRECLWQILALYAELGERREDVIPVKVIWEVGKLHFEEKATGYERGKMRGEGSADAHGTLPCSRGQLCISNLWQPSVQTIQPKKKESLIGCHLHASRNALYQNLGRGLGHLQCLPWLSCQPLSVYVLQKWAARCREPRGSAETYGALLVY